jgi:hypothetical protein
MKPIPLGELRLWPSHHRSALWWLGLLYRRPRNVHKTLRDMTRLEALASAAILYLHALPWVLLLVVLGRLVLFGWAGLPLSPLAAGNLFPLLLAHSTQVAVGIAVGIGFGIALTRAYYLPAHLLFVWPEPRGHLYPRHPVAWDDPCGMAFPGLSRLLASYAGHHRPAAEAEIERLLDSYATQRMEALRARVLLIAGDAGKETDLSRLDLAVAGMPEGDEGFLRQVPQLKEMIAEIALLQRRLATVSTPAFREPLSGQLVQEIEAFRGRISGFGYPLADGFRDAADAWLEVARHQLGQVRRVLGTAPVAEVFRAGDPVDRAKEAFVPRTGVIEELQGQAALRLGCPGLLLYARRRWASRA